MIPAGQLLLTLYVSGASFFAADAACAAEADCAYNGACKGGRCICSPPWKGSECQVLDLAVVPHAAGLRENITSTWGGSIVHGDDGQLYMYAAEMVAHCGIGAWTRNSRIILAVADSIISPFRFEKELFGVFSHEPAAVRAPTGEYVIFFTTTAFGCGSYGPCVPKDLCPHQNTTYCNPGGPICLKCGQGWSGHACKDNSTIEQSPRVRFPTYMVWSKNPAGPFSKPVMVYSGSDTLGNEAPATGDTNMASVIFEDGSLVGMWRGDRKDVGRSAYQYQYTVTAQKWWDPNTYVWGQAVRANNIFPDLVVNETRTCGIEDPSLYLDEKGVIHAVVHNWRAGGHATSADRGKTWRWHSGNCSASRGPSSVDWTRSVWPEQVHFDDGTVTTPVRRERPHVVVGRDGKVVALSTSVVLGKSDASWTLVQAVKSTRLETAYTIA